MTANRRKILVPLATLTVAGAVAVGSGASFTSTTASTTSVSSGNVTHVNDTTALDITNIKDGDTVTGTVTVENTGTLASTLTLDSTDADGTFIGSDLNLQLLQDGAEFYNGSFKAVDDAPLFDLDQLEVGESTTVTFVVSLNESADNTNEGKSASASFTWVSTQLEGEGIPFVSTFTGAFGLGD